MMFGGQTTLRLVKSRAQAIGKIVNVNVEVYFDVVAHKL